MAQLTTNEVQPTASRRYWNPQETIVDGSTQHTPGADRMLWSARQIDMRKADRRQTRETFEMSDDFLGSSISEFWMVDDDRTSAQQSTITIGKELGAGGILMLRTTVPGSQCALSACASNICVATGFHIKCRFRMPDSSVRLPLFSFGAMGSNIVSDDQVHIASAADGSWQCTSARDRIVTSLSAVPAGTQTALRTDSAWHTATIATASNDDLVFYMDDVEVARISDAATITNRHLSVFVTLSTATNDDNPTGAAATVWVDYVHIIGGRSGASVKYDGTTVVTSA